MLGALTEVGRQTLQQGSSPELGGPACQGTAIEGAFPASLGERSWA